MEIVDREGVGALNMRRLASDLGVEAMSLYRYAPGKEAILDGVVETLFVEVGEVLGRMRPVPPGDWRGELRRTARAVHRVGSRHPNVVPLVATGILSVPMARRPPEMLWLAEHVLTLLREAGVDDRRALAAYRSFSAWVLGYVLMDLRSVVEDPDEPDPGMRVGMHRLDRATFPTLRSLGRRLADRGGERELLQGLDALMDAMTST